jgi:hypothetical protein
MSRCTLYNFLWMFLWVTCWESVIFFEYSGFLHQKFTAIWRYNWSVVEDFMSGFSGRAKFVYTSKILCIIPGRGWSPKFFFVGRQLVSFRNQILTQHLAESYGILNPCKIYPGFKFLFKIPCGNLTWGQILVILF